MAKLIDLRDDREVQSQNLREMLDGADQLRNVLRENGAPLTDRQDNALDGAIADMANTSGQTAGDDDEEDDGVLDDFNPDTCPNCGQDLPADDDDDDSAAVNDEDDDEEAQDDGVAESVRNGGAYIGADGRRRFVGTSRLVEAGRRRRRAVESNRRRLVEI